MTDVGKMDRTFAQIRILGYLISAWAIDVDFVVITNLAFYKPIYEYSLFFVYYRSDWIVYIAE